MLVKNEEKQAVTLNTPDYHKNETVSVVTNRFEVREIIIKPISGCNTYESRGTGIGCRC